MRVNGERIASNMRLIHFTPCVDRVWNSSSGKWWRQIQLLCSKINWTCIRKERICKAMGRGQGSSLSWIWYGLDSPDFSLCRRELQTLGYSSILCLSSRQMFFSVTS